MIRAWFSHTKAAEELAYDQLSLDFECGERSISRLQTALTTFLPFGYTELRLGGGVYEYVMLLHTLAPTLFDVRTLCSLIAY